MFYFFPLSVSVAPSLPSAMRRFRFGSPSFPAASSAAPSNSNINNTLKRKTAMKNARNFIRPLVNVIIVNEYFRPSIRFMFAAEAVIDRNGRFPNARALSYFIQNAEN